MVDYMKYYCMMYSLMVEMIHDKMFRNIKQVCCISDVNIGRILKFCLRRQEVSVKVIRENRINGDIINKLTSKEQTMFILDEKQHKKISKLLEKNGVLRRNIFVLPIGVSRNEGISL